MEVLNLSLIRFFINDFADKYSSNLAKVNVFTICSVSNLQGDRILIFKQIKTFVMLLHQQSH